MTMKKDNVHRIDDYKEDAQSEKIRQEINADTSRDMGKVGLLISVLAVVLLAVLYFGLNQNIEGLGGKVAELDSLKAGIADVNAKVATMEGRIAGLEKLPAETRKVIVGNMLDEMAGKAAIIGGQIGDKDQAAKLAQAMQLLQEVRTDLK